MRGHIAKKGNRYYAVIYERIDPETGLIADATTLNAYFQPFVEGTEPTRTADETTGQGDAERALRADAF